MFNAFVPRPEHPNPIFKRDSWRNLNGEWLFEIDYGVSGKDRGMQNISSSDMYTRKITVPFCPESKLSGIEVKDFMPSVWYKKSVNISEKELSGRVLIHFGAVDYECDIWVNGEAAGSHRGGYTPITVDITDLLTVGENDITLNARDDQRSGKQPRGKQCPVYHSRVCDYTRTTGIWQTVWLEFVSIDYIKSVKYYPDINESAFDIELILSESGKITAEAFYNGKAVGKATKNAYGTSARLRLPLSEKHLWEVGNGRLYDIVLTLETENGIDTVKSYAGLREVKIDGFRVLINEKSVFQRTVLDQGYYPDGIYTAPTAEALKKDIELSLALGFNGARLHQKVFEPLFLYYCDKMGYLVWGEHASWGLDVTLDSAFINFLPEWSEAVERDFNHPAIIGWCPLNEVWQWHDKGLDKLHFLIHELYKSTKLLDPTRPVIDASGGFHTETDIMDQHDYEQNTEKFKASYKKYDGSKESFDYFHSSRQSYIPGLPFFMSEYGGMKWIPEDKRDGAQADAWGYGSGPKTEEEFITRYERLTEALLDAPNIMGFCYTQLYDVEQEKNGLYTYERENKFSDYSRIIAVNSKKAAIED